MVKSLQYKYQVAAAYTALILWRCVVFILEYNEQPNQQYTTKGSMFVLCCFCFFCMYILFTLMNWHKSSLLPLSNLALVFFCVIPHKITGHFRKVAASIGCFLLNLLYYCYLILFLWYCSFWILWTKLYNAKKNQLINLGQMEFVLLLLLQLIYAEKEPPNSKLSIGCSHSSIQEALNVYFNWDVLSDDNCV